MTSPTQSSDSPRARLLLADDDELLCRGLVMTLASQNYDITVTHTAAGAEQLLKTQDFDLLISDIHMSGNHKLELLRGIPREKGLPVILITGYPEVGTAIAAMKLSVVDYLTKPISPPELRQSVERGLAWGRAVRQLNTAHAEVSEWLEMLGDVRDALQQTPALAQNSPPSGSPADLLERLNDEERALLTPREIEIIEAFTGGQRIQEIATAFSVSVHTVRNHFRSIFSKLNVNSQVELLLKLFGAVGPA